jgi:amidase
VVIGPYASAGEIADAVAARRVGVRELVDAAIARIEADDRLGERAVNAVVVRDFERARAQADAADAALARGEATAGRPLLGVPVTVKESLDVAGLRKSWGHAAWRDHVSQEDAVVVARLEAAGAILLGKSNVPEMLGDDQSYNEIHGVTRNPWDTTRTPGGSSGGAAAALAAGFVALEVGTDVGGSLARPAHFCGVYAHRPSLHLVPLRGAAPPGAPPIPAAIDMVTVGPMARSAGDLARALDVVAGPDELRDGVGYRVALPPPRHAQLRDFRVLVIDSHPLFPTAAEVRGALEAFAGALAGAGCRVARDSPLLPDLGMLTRAFFTFLAAVHSPQWPEEMYQRMCAARAALDPGDDSLRACLLRGATQSHREHLGRERRRDGLRARWRELFQSIDVLVCPAAVTTAFPHAHDQDPLERLIDVDGARLPARDQGVWAAAPSLLGVPATTIPIARAPSTGLPIGAQVIGPYLEDRTTLAFAAAVERALGGFVPPPPRAPAAAAGLEPPPGSGPQ